MRMYISVAIVAALLASSGCFVLERADGLPSGTLIGVVEDSSGIPVAGAVVQVAGLQRTVVTGNDGGFRFSGLPIGGHAIVALLDRDADGISDEGALRTALVPTDPRTDIAVGVDIGVVPLVPTGTLTGRTVDDAQTPIGAATVALWRSVALSQNGVDFVQIDLAAEAVVESDAGGTFTIRGLVAGEAFFAAFDSVANVATRGSIPQSVAIPAGATADAGDVGLAALDGTRKARISFAEVEDGEVELRITPTGKARPATPTQTVQGAASVLIDVPFGIWDVYLTSGIRNAVLLGQVAPPLGPDEVSWGIAELVAGDDVCGDGFVTGAEESCDDGDDNSDTAPDACRKNCQPASCGDGATDTGEGCDDGAANSDTAADACRTDCQPAGCGDGVVDAAEGCDDGVNNSDTAANACRTDCQPAGCGDGVIDTDEACDDGVNNSDVGVDACRTSCEVPRCGDTVIDTGEVCDDGAANTTTCVPQGVTPCSFCDIETCGSTTIQPTATVTVVVTSVQGWGVNPLAGVKVSFAGTEGLTDASGVFALTVTLPLPADAAAVVGDNRDAVITDRSFVRTLVPLPQTLVHGATATVAAQVMEGCAIDQVGSVVSTIAGTCSFLQQDMGWGINDGALLVSGTQTPLDATAPYTIRLAGTPNGLFEDPSVVYGFPETVAADGRLLTCRDIFDLRVDGADLNPDPQGAFIMFPVSGLNQGDAAFVFDEAQGAFVEVPEAIVGQDVTALREGTWCIGSAAAADACIVTSVDAAGGAVAEDVTVHVTNNSFGFTHVTGVMPAGQPTCIPFFSNTFPTATAVTADGRRGSGVIQGEVLFNAETCAVEAACATLPVTFDVEASDGCVNVAATFLPFFDVVSLPVTQPIAVIEPSEGTFYRGRLVFTDERNRCLLVPNGKSNLRYIHPDLDIECADGQGETQVDTFRSQAPTPPPDVCADIGVCEVDLGLADFFCGS